MTRTAALRAAKAIWPTAHVEVGYGVRRNPVTRKLESSTAKEYRIGFLSEIAFHIRATGSTWAEAVDKLKAAYR